MQTVRFHPPVLSCLLSSLFFVSVVTLVPGITQAQQGGHLTVEQAALLAGGHIQKELSAIPGWIGATLGPVRPHYDLDGRVAVYVFSVVKDSRDAGYITVSAQNLPNPVFEFSTAPARYLLAQPQMQSPNESLRLDVDEQPPLYLGLLAYFYRVRGPGPVRLLEMGTWRVTTVEGILPLLPAPQQTNSSLFSPETLPSYSQTLPNIRHSASTPQSTVVQMLHGPDYEWYRGCGPTAVANVMGYWADRGYPNLVYGGSGGIYTDTIDQLATLMGTSPEGWTWLPINDDIRNFAVQKGYSFQSAEMNMPAYSTFVSEIVAHRPVVVLVNDHTFYGNHFITGFGYEYDPSDPNYRYMIVHDTWGNTAVDYWVQYGTGYSRIWFDTVAPPNVQVDTVPPASLVQPLTPIQTSQTFSVSWSGSDTGWGIKWFDVRYRLDQNGAWINWFTRTAATRMDFTGVRVHTYCFQSRAMDIDHNQESYPDVADTCTTISPPSLAINYLIGKPGSIFSLVGTDFPSSSTITVTINGRYLGPIFSDPAGRVSFMLDTSQADVGSYAVTTVADLHISTGFILDINAPLRPREGNGTIFDVPGGIALNKHIRMPIVRK